MNTCAIVEGRLMEINVAEGYRTPADVDTMMGMMKDTITKAGTPVVVFADWRGCGLFTDTVSERVTWMLTRDNPMIERSAILHNDAQKTFMLQVGRLIRESGHHDRRAFSLASEIDPWLGEKLTPAERARLDKLLQG